MGNVVYLTGEPYQPCVVERPNSIEALKRFFRLDNDEELRSAMMDFGEAFTWQVTGLEKRACIDAHMDRIRDLLS